MKKIDRITVSLKINKEINANVNTNTNANANIIEKQNVLYQSEISNVQIIKNRNKNVNRSYLTTAGLFAAFFLLSPSSKKIIPGFSEIRERIQVNSVQSSLSKSTEELSRHILKQKSNQHLKKVLIYFPSEKIKPKQSLEFVEKNLKFKI